MFVDGGGITVLGARVPLPIKGKGFLRCLYVDKDMRVFESPVDEKTSEQWEERGLVVVQVRAGLLKGTDWRPAYA